MLSSPIGPSDFPNNVDVATTEKNEQQQPRPPWTSLPSLLKSDNSSDFAVFKLNQGFSYYAMAVIAFQTIFNVLRAFNMNTDGVPGAIKVIAGMKCFAPIIGWIYFYLSSQYVNSTTLTAEGKRIFFFGNMSLLVHTIFTGATVLSWVLTRDDCDSDACLQDIPKHILPLGLFGNSIIGGLSMTLFFPCHDVYVCFLSMAINISSLITSVVLLGMPKMDIIGVSTVSIIMCILIVLYEENMLSLYTAFSKFKIALRAKVTSKNKEYLMETQTEEMRHMLGTSMCLCVCAYVCLYVNMCLFVCELCMFMGFIRSCFLL